MTLNWSLDSTDCSYAFTKVSSVSANDKGTTVSSSHEVPSIVGMILFQAQVQQIAFGQLYIIVIHGITLYPAADQLLSLLLINMNLSYSPGAVHLIDVASHLALKTNECVASDEITAVFRLTCGNRRRMSESIPEEILGMICNETKHPPDAGNTIWRKHQKNLNVLSLSQVCRTWRSHITNNATLWMDIALDVSEARSVKVAGLFLQMIEELDLQFRVYAGFGEAIDPGIIDLLIKLRPLIPRIRYFQYTGEIEGYIQYLDLPADNLRHFIGRVDPVPFSGRMSTLRTLTTTPGPAADRTAWITSIPNLTCLELEPPCLGQDIPLQPILDMLRATPRIVKLRLSCFGILSDVAGLSERVTLRHLEILELPYSDFQTVANCLETPSAREIVYYGSEYPPGYDTAAPLFRSPHMFANISSFPTRGRNVSAVGVVTALHGSIWVFSVNLKTHDGFSLDIRMSWSTPLETRWEEYIEGSLLGLEEHISLSTGVFAGFFFWIPFSRPPRIPFLLSSRVDHLAIHGGPREELIRRLATRSGPESWFPELKRLFIVGEILGSDTGVDALVSCLRTRGTRLAVYIRCERFLWADLVRLGCDVEGNVVLLSVTQLGD